jgi:hypothetical protein
MRLGFAPFRGSNPRASAPDQGVCAKAQAPWLVLVIIFVRSWHIAGTTGNDLVLAGNECLDRGACAISASSSARQASRAASSDRASSSAGLGLAWCAAGLQSAGARRRAAFPGWLPWALTFSLPTLEGGLGGRRLDYGCRCPCSVGELRGCWVPDARAAAGRFLRRGDGWGVPGGGRRWVLGLSAGADNLLWSRRMTGRSLTVNPPAS